MNEFILFVLCKGACDIVIFPVVFNFVLPSVECKAVFDSVSTTADWITWTESSSESN